MKRARFYSQARVFANEAELFAALDRGELDVEHEVGLVGVAWSNTHAVGEVDFLSRTPEQDALRYRTTGPGIIFVSVTDYPGWVSNYPMVRTFGAFHGVIIPQAGEGVVEVRFEPTIWRWGALLSTVGGALALWFTSRYGAAPS